MKSLIALLFVLFGVNNLVFAQLPITSFPFTSRNFDVQSLSLGSATVSLPDQNGNTRINPAGIGEKGVLQVSPNWSTLVVPQIDSFREYRMNVNYKFGNSAIAFRVQRMETGEHKPAFFYPTAFGQKFNSNDMFTSLSYSHSLKNNFRIGASLNYLYGGESTGSSISARKTEAVDTWSVDLGFQYEFSKRMDNLTLQPNFGMSLTNFGQPVEYFDPGTSDPLPTKLQAGVGMKLSSTNEVFDKKQFELTLLQNASKIMARTELKGTDSNLQFSAMNPFKALIRSWDNYIYFDGHNTITATPIEQIWWHSGVEIKWVETLSLRMGYEHAAKREERLSYWSVGAGLDLYYLVFDYAYLSDTYAGDDYGDYFSGHHWQLTGRIPLNGNKPDTILNEFFK